MSPKLRIPNIAKHIVDRVKWVQFVFITTKQIRLLEFPFWNWSSIFANHIVVVVAVLELNRPNESVGKMNIASILMANIKWWRMLRQHLEMDNITCPVKKQTRQILKNERNEIQIKNEITKIKCNVPTLLVISEWLKSTHKWQWLPPFTHCVQNVKIIQFQARARSMHFIRFGNTCRVAHYLFQFIHFWLPWIDFNTFCAFRVLDSNGNNNNNNAPTPFSNLSRIAAVATIGWKVLPMLE